jgi:hypothetical protein
MHAMQQYSLLTDNILQAGPTVVYSFALLGPPVALWVFFVQFGGRIRQRSNKQET